MIHAAPEMQPSRVYQRREVYRPTPGEPRDYARIRDAGAGERDGTSFAVAASIMNNALSTLERLRAGNRRFVRNFSKSVPTKARRASLVDGQAPKAIVLACADSRVPPELVFDQGLGDIFVVRVAGNVCSPMTLASIEYAATALEVPLVIVLGHTKCGAVKATIDAVTTGKKAGSASLDDLVDRITPAVTPFVDRGLRPADLLSRATLANVVLAGEALQRESPILDARVRSGELTVVSAEYALETGEVTFFGATDASEASAA